MAVTSFDVARAAGVSQSTVSRALSGHPNISAETVRRVREAAEALHYVPSDRARDLSTRSTRRIALVVDLDNPLWSLLVTNLYDELARQHYRLSLVAEHGDPSDLESQVLGGSVDGVIVSTASTQSRLPGLLAARGVPTVLLHRFTDDVDLDACVADNEDGGRLAARLLVEAGHRDIGALLGPGSTSTAAAREQGFVEELARLGVHLRSDAVARGEFMHEHGRSATARLIGEGRLPRAVFCANDIIAIGAMNAARSAGLRVPHDLALVGFDDLTESSWPMIDLTTISVPFGDMLRSAVTQLLQRIGGDTSPGRRIVHPVSAVARSSHLTS